MNISKGIVVILIIAGILVIVAAASILTTQKKISALRARGIYPKEGKESEEDVIRLLQAGERIMAIKCYRTVHNVGLKEAKDAVELLEKKGPVPSIPRNCS